MLGIWFEDQRLSVRTDIDPPVNPPGESLLRIRLAGICGTDLHLLNGYYGFRGIPGHEFVADVMDSDQPALIGARVVGEINAACGGCSTCLSGDRAHCPDRTVLGIIGRNGAFAEYLSLPTVNLHRVPEGLSDERAVFCEPLAAALRVSEQIHIGPTDRILVVGAGRLGQLIVRALLLNGGRVSAVCRSDRPRELLQSYEIPSLDPDEVLRAKWDVVVEATGSPDGIRIAQDAVKPRGTIVLKSTFADDVPVDLSRIAVDEVRLVGSRCGPFQPALEMLRRKLVEVSDLIEATYPLEDGAEAVARASEAGTLKVMLRP